VQSSRDRTTVVANRVSPERDALKSMSIRTDAADEDDYLFIIRRVHWLSLRASGLLETLRSAAQRQRLTEVGVCRNAMTADNNIVSFLMSSVTFRDYRLIQANSAICFRTLYGC